ncbi:SDR family oxidoreductase [Chryseobacterium taihuense]|uniref:Amidohydrolase, PncC family n=1 Tax=Chryseobacterium taihuense TaxID=1141221 RepID=A0ABY0QPM3_9FLAO|nr:SDR family oxidoreductase [Chryseobacterium taihuense]SDL44582.1 amidohydrolase, PncC family [Chryseobacterium taihuense]
MELEKNLLSEIGQLLADIDETVAVAESVTSGYLQFCLSQMKDASKFYWGGITAYTLDEKVKFLQISSKEGEACNCVSESISEVMALNVAKSFNTDWGISVTGYATPVEESDFKLFAYFSFSHKGKIVYSKRLDLHPHTQSQNAQICYAEYILGCFKIQLEKHLSQQYDNNTMEKLLLNKTAIITGGNSGIGKAIALLFAKQGANVAIMYYDGDDEAKSVEEEIVASGSKCMMMKGDIGESRFCEQSVQKITDEWGQIDILINNAGTQIPSDHIINLKEDDIRKTFNSNIIGMILLTKAVFPHLKEGGCIINTTSAVAYQGHAELLDYSATKGAIVSFTRSLALQAKPLGIRVNAVAPGPVATPLTKKTFGEEKEDLSKPPLQRNASTEEIANSYLFLVSGGSVQMTGQVLHPNGGIIVNG